MKYLDKLIGLRYFSLQIFRANTVLRTCKKPQNWGFFILWRRRGDLNPRTAFDGLPHFECGPFSHLGTSP